MMHVFNNSPLAPCMRACVCVPVHEPYVRGCTRDCVKAECASLCRDVLDMAADGP